MSYTVLTEELSTQVIVFTATLGGAASFTLSWFSIGASLIAPPLLISMLLLRSLTQQVSNQMDYLKFKKIINKMLDDDDLKQTLQPLFMEGEGPVGSSSRIKMGLPDLDKNTTLKYDFIEKSSEELDEFIKQKVKEEFELFAKILCINFCCFSSVNSSNSSEPQFDLLLEQVLLY